MIYDQVQYEAQDEQAYYEPVVSATHSGFVHQAGMGLGTLLREGLVTVLILFFAIGLPAWKLGTTGGVRASICSLAFIVTLIGVLAARTLGGRVLQALAYAVIFENNYAFQHFPILPSTILLVIVIALSRIRQHIEPVLLWRGNNSLRTVVRVCVWMVLFGILVAAALNTQWFTYSLISMMDIHIPAILFGVAGAMMLRRGSADVFLGILPFLATIAAITVWVYTFAGVKLLYYLKYVEAGREVARYGGILRNPNNTGCFCAAMALLGFVRLRQVSGKLKLLLIVNSLFLIGTILHLRSRGPVFVLGLGGMMVLLRKGLKRWAVVLAVCGAIGYALFGGTLAATRVEGAESLTERIQAMPRAIAVRLKIYADSISAIPKYPLGYGQVEGVLTRVEKAHLGITRESHNEYITFVLQNGMQSVLPALVLGIGLMVAWFGCKVRREPHRPGLGITVLLLCFVVTASFEPIYSNCEELGMLFGATLGMVIGSLIYARPQSETDFYLAGDEVPYPLPALS